MFEETSGNLLVQPLNAYLKQDLLNQVAQGLVLIKL